MAPHLALIAAADGIGDQRQLMFRAVLPHLEMLPKVWKYFLSDFDQRTGTSLTRGSNVKVSRYAAGSRNIWLFAPNEPRQHAIKQLTALRPEELNSSPCLARTTEI